jgi:hypothetical protein
MNGKNRKKEIPSYWIMMVLITGQTRYHYAIRAMPQNYNVG